MSGKTNKSLVEIHVTQLKPGMFVAELDCGWQATPFAVQGLLIRSQTDVDRLFDCARTPDTSLWMSTPILSICAR